VKQKNRVPSFTESHNSLTKVLVDHGLASLGDTFVNLVCSLALSNKRGKACGTRVKGSLLAEGLRRAGLRSYVPSRATRHTLADAAEALIVYAWLKNCITLEESVATLEKSEDLAEGLNQLLQTIIRRIKLS
jgi:hypothetical protein